MSWTACWLGCTRKKPVSSQITTAARTIRTTPLIEPRPPGMRFLRRSWPLRMTSSMSGGRRPNGLFPPPLLPLPPFHGPPPFPPPPPLPQGQPLLLFHAIHHLAARGTFAFTPGCIYVTAGLSSIKRRHLIARLLIVSGRREQTWQKSPNR